MISDSDAKRFQAIYEKEMGEKITLDEARECAESLCSFIKEIYKPLKKGEIEKCTSSENEL